MLAWYRRRESRALTRPLSLSPPHLKSISCDIPSLLSDCGILVAAGRENGLTNTLSVSSCLVGRHSRESLRGLFTEPPPSREWAASARRTRG